MSLFLPQSPLRPSLPFGLLRGVALTVAAGLVAAGAAGVEAAPSAAAVPPVAAQAVEGPRLVGQDPDDRTPQVSNGEVRALAEVGRWIVVGGSFTNQRDANTAKALGQAYLFAYDRQTGLVDPTFRPVIDGPVEDLEPTADGAGVYVAGGFRTVNGVKRSYLARLALPTGELASFDAALTGRVLDLTLVAGRLYATGYFAKARGKALGGLAALDPTTGAVDPRLVLPLTSYKADTGVRRVVVTPDGSRMVLAGNIQSVGGVARSQLAVVDLTTTPATVRADWATAFFPMSQRGILPNLRTYVRDLDVSADGRYVVVGTTFYHPGEGDSLSRWEIGAAGADLRPTWIRYTGSDTITDVELSRDGVVYFGGHFRWFNVHRDIYAYIAGGVTLFGLGAADASTGLPYHWAPTRVRGYGVLAMLLTRDGDLVIGHDTSTVAGETRSRLASFPAAGGRATLVASTATLPLQVTQNRAGVTSELTFDGTSATSVAARALPAEVRAGVVLGERLLAATSSGLFVYEPGANGAWTRSTRLDAYGLVPAAITGLAFADGTVYWTYAGDVNLYSRAVNTDSLVFEHLTRTASGPGTAERLNWAGCTGLFAAADQLYAACSGVLKAVPFAALGTAGTTLRTVDSVAAGGRDWSGVLVGGGRPAAADRVNLALRRPATQSSSATSPSLAVDGNRDGHLGYGSVALTGSVANSWWQVDLGSVQPIGELRIWGRTDAQQQWTSNLWVYLSDTPFTSADPAATRAQPGVTTLRVAGLVGLSATLAANRSARYVRIQSPGLEAAYGLYQALAEVEVYSP